MQIFSTSHRSFDRRLGKRRAGFTLIEIMVSVGIMLVILSIILLNQSNYTNSSSVEAQAEDISLSLREAQVYGVSVKERAVGTGDFTAAYGVEFLLPSLGGANNSYITFADRNGNSVYDSGWACPLGGASECISQTLFPNPNIIQSLCAISASGAENCTLAGVEVVYHRPVTEPVITYFDSTGTAVAPGAFVGARVKLVSKDGSGRTVAAYTSGQISVQ
jgi:prepilin-type N-terminal cleavage/methylation domain-containing protein